MRPRMSGPCWALREAYGARPRRARSSMRASAGRPTTSASASSASTADAVGDGTRNSWAGSSPAGRPCPTLSAPALRGAARRSDRGGPTVATMRPIRPAVDEIEAHAEAVDDRDRRFPTEGLDALRRAGLLALGVPAAYGGPGGGPHEVAAAIRSIGGICGSTSMVYAMHLVAVQTLLADPGAGRRPEGRGAARDRDRRAPDDPRVLGEGLPQSLLGADRARGARRRRGRDRRPEDVGDVGGGGGLVRRRDRLAGRREPAPDRPLPRRRAQRRDHGAAALRGPRDVRQRLLRSRSAASACRHRTASARRARATAR